MSVEDVQQMSCSELFAQYEPVVREIAALSGDPTTLNIVDVNAALQSGDYSDVEVQAAFEFNRKDCILPSSGGGTVAPGMSDRLAREIINNTPLSAGDKIDSSSLLDTAAAYREGGVSRAALDYAQQLYKTGGRLPDPSSGGSGGGGGGSDPSPQPGPEPDRSQLSARLENLSSSSPEQMTVYWSVTNEVTSGTGQQKSGTVAIDLDGRTQERQSVSVSPGGSQSGSVRLADVTPGTREVCVRLQ